jgi:tRNA threonylcarbamoyladenosine biosynthesis protein TsaB
MYKTNKASLVIDGSGGSVFAGLLDAENRWLVKVDRDGAPLEELFPVIKIALTESRLSFADIGSYIYCEGPGSVLGLRLCAMAIETWTRLYPKSAQYYKYNSLQLSAHALLHAIPDLQDALIVADWKKGAWNALYIKGRHVGATEVIDDASLSDWENLIYHLPQRKGWQCPPDKVQTLRYDPSILDAISKSSGLLQMTNHVELYSSGINTFQKWTRARHRAQN